MDMQRMYTQENIDNIFTDGRDNIRLVEVVDDSLGKRIYVTDYIYNEGLLRKEEYQSILVSELDLNVIAETGVSQVNELLGRTKMDIVDFEETDVYIMHEFNNLFALKVEDLYDSSYDEDLLVWKAVA